MKKISAMASGILASITGAANAEWRGVDSTVIEKFAADAGRSASPLIPAADGDLLLFCFLVAGAAGGFVFGYYFKSVFPAKKERD